MPHSEQNVVEIGSFKRGGRLEKRKKNESVHLPLICWRKITKLAIAQLSVSQKLHVGNLVLEIACL